LLALLAAAWLAIACRPAAAAPTLTAEEIQELTRQAQDSTRAGEVSVRLKRYLAEGPEGMYRTWARNTLLMALLVSRAPADEVAEAADSVAGVLPDDHIRRAAFYTGLADLLGQRPDGLAHATRYAQRALDALPPTPDAVQATAIAKSVMGGLRLKGGDARAAIPLLEEGIAEHPDSASVLARLGEAYRAAGQPQAAIGAYVRAAGAFPLRDTSMVAPLRALWAKQHRGSLAGLDARVAVVREASTRRVALEARRDERPAPDLTLSKLTDSTATVSLRSLRGKVVVVDFWGSWCGPCRIELPIFQALHDRYQGRSDVAFLGINWERPAPAAVRRQRAWDYMVENRLTFPTVIDLDTKAVEEFKVEGFPTVFVIDRQGKIRYSNRGVSEGIEQILEAQIKSLL
jgi:thiol-disulfide isomerase/thioredoxin